MPAGPKLISSVFQILKTDEGKTPKQIAYLLGDVGIWVSPRAVRYALKALIDAGRATRNEAVHGENDRFYFAVAQQPEEVAA